MTGEAEDTPPGSGVLVAVCRERADGERRVALTPDEVKRLLATGARVRIERGAGASAGFPDESYALAGAELADDPGAALAGADVVLRVAPPSDEEIAQIPATALLISYLRPLDHPEIVQALAARGVSALAMEMMPRITRAQSMDALSSQSNIAGYKAGAAGRDARCRSSFRCSRPPRARFRRPRCWCSARASRGCRRSRRRAAWVRSSARTTCARP